MFFWGKSYAHLLVRLESVLRQRIAKPETRVPAERHCLASRFAPRCSRPSPVKVRAIIADDEPLARERVRSLLVGEPDIEVVEECSDAARTFKADTFHVLNVKSIA